MSAGRRCWHTSTDCENWVSVIKNQVGTLEPITYGGVLGLFDVKFERRNRNFSSELVEFLKTEIKLSPTEIQQLEQQASYQGV